MITLNEAKQHLRVDHTAEDADIGLKLRLAVAIVEDYVGAGSFEYGLPTEVMDAATLLVLGELYANREAGADPLSRTVRLILERTRRPACA